ncbi:serine/threonine-protein kinase [Actinoplanes sp. NPDC051343]|uniref:serine/threonine-protein kinase n=1 Tax=Actinoplanes sp. NPDC051343 TaxID=3363906 RepID=UPI0037A49531
MLGDRYRLDDRIAAGGMGEVWQATDTVLGRDVAIKTLKGDRATDPSFQNRFQHEARAMAVLHHPGVADVYDYGETGDGSDAYIVMARVQGEPLNQLIASRGRLTPVETMSIVAQAARALEAAHQAGIVHRDVKPSNLIVEPDGTVVLVDFGVARSTQSAALTGAKEVVGTALYIAPEQVSKQTTGPPADVYALGAVAYHCLTGHPPFPGNNPIAVAMQHLKDPPPALPGDIPEPVRVLVATALAKDPAQRFSSAAAMADAADAGRRLLAGPPDSTAALAAVVDPARVATATALGVDPALPPDDGRGFARGVANGRDPDARTPGAGGAGAFGAAGAGASGAGGFAAGAATEPVAGPATSVMPAPLADPPAPPGKHRRALLIVAGIMIALLAVLGILAFANPGGHDDKNTPAVPSAPVSVSPSAKTNPGGAPQHTETGRSHHTTEPTSGHPTTTAPKGGGGDETTEPTGKPSHTPSSATTTKQTPTTPPATTGDGPPATGAAGGTGAGGGTPTADVVAVATPEG